MTRFHLRFGAIRLSFGPQLLLWLSAALAVSMLLSAYVDALHASVRRGEALRQAQLSGEPLSASARRIVAPSAAPAGEFAALTP